MMSVFTIKSDIQGQQSMGGIIDISQLKTPPEKHELDTAKYFSDRGHDVVFLAPSNIPEAHTPDILMDGIEWEMKSPQGKGKRTIEKIIHKAASQSRYIIFDLRRINIPERQCIAQLEHRFNTKRYIKCLRIIKKDEELVEYTR